MFGHSFHKGLSAPPDHGTGNHGVTDLGVGADLESVLAEPSCQEECTLSDPRLDRESDALPPLLWGPGVLRPGRGSLRVTHTGHGAGPQGLRVSG